jgi:hypothetical protein
MTETGDMTFKLTLKVGNKAGVKKEIQDILKDAGFMGASIKQMKGAQSGGMSGGFAGAMIKGLAGFSLIEGAVSLIAQQFGGLTSLVKGIGRIIIEFLRPIADVITILLMPVLAILRPILMVFRTIMAPFRKAALQLSASGAQDMANGNFGEGFAKSIGALQLLFTGVNIVLLKLMEEVVKAALTGLTYLLAVSVASTLSLFGFSFDAVFGFIMEKGKLVTDAVEYGFGTAAAVLSLQSAEMLKMLGGDVTQFVKDIQPMLTGVFISDDNSLKNQFITNTATLLSSITPVLEGITPAIETAMGFDTLKTSLETGFLGLSTALKNGIEKMFGDASGGIPAGGSAGGGGAGGGFLSSVGNFVANTDLFQGILSLTKKFFGDATTPGDAGTLWSDGLQGLSSTNTSFLTGMNSSYARELGTNGAIPTMMGGGMVKMSKSASDFDKATGAAARGVASSVKTALNAASLAVSQAEKYASMIRKLKNQRSD